MAKHFSKPKFRGKKKGKAPAIVIVAREETPEPVKPPSINGEVLVEIMRASVDGYMYGEIITNETRHRRIRHDYL